MRVCGPEALPPEELAVSIVMPIHNGGSYLEETLGSLCSQTLDSCEFICVDDGSVDSSFDIVQRFAHIDSRFVPMSQKASGAAAARNLGLTHARGRYVLFLDSDDFFYSEMVESMSRVMDGSCCDVCICEYNAVDCKRGSKIRMEVTKCFPREKAVKSRSLPNLFELSCSPWNKMFRRELIAKHNLRFQDLANTNDALFVTCAMARADSIYVLGQPLMEYRFNRGDSLQDQKRNSPGCALEAAKAIAGALKDVLSPGDVRCESLAVRCASLAIASISASAYDDAMLIDSIRSAREFFAGSDLEKLPKSVFPGVAEWLKYKSVVVGETEAVANAFRSFGFARTHSVLSKSIFAVRLIGIIAKRSCGRRERYV